MRIFLALYWTLASTVVNANAFDVGRSLDSVAGAANDLSKATHFMSLMSGRFYGNAFEVLSKLSSTNAALQSQIPAVQKTSAVAALDPVMLLTYKVPHFMEQYQASLASVAKVKPHFSPSSRISAYRTLINLQTSTNQFFDAVIAKFSGHEKDQVERLSHPVRKYMTELVALYSR